MWWKGSDSNLLIITVSLSQINVKFGNVSQSTAMQKLKEHASDTKVLQGADGPALADIDMLFPLYVSFLRPFNK